MGRLLSNRFLKGENMRKGVLFQKALKENIDEKVKHIEIDVNVLSDPHDALILSYGLMKLRDVVNHKISIVRIDKSGSIPDMIEVNWEKHTIIAVEAESINDNYRIDKKKIQYIKKYFHGASCSLPFDGLLIVTPKKEVKN